MLQPITLTAAAALPTIYIRYIRCTTGYDPTDKDIQRQDARIRSEPTRHHRELAASHAAPFTVPRVLAGMILGAVV